MAGEYKGLNIMHHESIEESIETYMISTQNSYSLDSIEIISDSQKRYHFTVDGIRMFIDFYFSKGKTTIQPRSGKPEHQEIKINLADFIKKKLHNVIESSNTLTVKNVSQENWDGLFEMIEELDSVNTTSDNKGTYRIIGIQKDDVTISYYPNGTLLMQGRPLRLFNEITTLISELLVETTQIVRINNSTYKKNISKDIVQRDFDVLMKNSKNKLPPKLEIVIKQSIYNSHINDDDMFDYTFLVFPTLRALEGHIKYVAKKLNLTIHDNKIGSLFNYNNKRQAHELKNPIGIPETITNHLEKQYVCYKQQRNVYFHWSDVTAPIDLTSMVYTPEGAKQKIFDILRDIDYYYSIC